MNLRKLWVRALWHDDVYRDGRSAMQLRADVDGDIRALNETERAELLAALVEDGWSRWREPRTRKPVPPPTTAAQWQQVASEGRARYGTH